LPFSISLSEFFVYDLQGLVRVAASFLDRATQPDLLFQLPPRLLSYTSLPSNPPSPFPKPSTDKEASSCRIRVISLFFPFSFQQSFSAFPFVGHTSSSSFLPHFPFLTFCVCSSPPGFFFTSNQPSCPVSNRPPPLSSFALLLTIERPEHDPWSFPP